MCVCLGGWGIVIWERERNALYTVDAELAPLDAVANAADSNAEVGRVSLLPPLVCVNDIIMFVRVLVLVFVCAHMHAGMLVCTGRHVCPIVC